MIYSLFMSIFLILILTYDNFYSSFLTNIEYSTLLFLSITHNFLYTISGYNYRTQSRYNYRQEKCCHENQYNKNPIIGGYQPIRQNRNNMK